MSGSGRHGALLLLAMPYLLTQVPLTLVDVPTMFFVTAAVYALIQALARGGAWIPVAVALVTAAALTKYSAWPMIAAAFAAILVVQRRQPAVVVRAGAVIAGGGLALGIYIVAAQDVVAAQLALLHDYQAPGLGRWRESLASTFLFQIHPFVTVAALLSLFVAWRRRDLRYAVLGAPWLVMLVFASGRIRYLVPLFPLLALMAAYGLELMRHARLERLVVWCAVTTSVAIAAFGYLPFPAADERGQSGKRRRLSRPARGPDGGGIHAAADGRGDQPRGLGAAARSLHAQAPRLSRGGRAAAGGRDLAVAVHLGSAAAALLRRACGCGAGSGRGRRHLKRARPGPAAGSGGAAQRRDRARVLRSRGWRVRVSEPWSRSTAARKTTSPGVESWKTSNARIWSGCS